MNDDRTYYSLYEDLYVIKEGLDTAQFWGKGTNDAFYNGKCSDTN